MYKHSALQTYLDYTYTTYSGEFVDGKFHGDGEISYQNTTFKGTFKDGKQHGFGQFTWSNGYYYKG